MGHAIQERSAKLAALTVGLVFAAASANSETITVTHWGAVFYGAPYAVAMEKGFFKDSGIDITGITTAKGGGTAVRNTVAGEIPFGEVATAAALEAIRSGQPLKIVMTGGQRSDSVWVSKPDAPYKSIHDLIGKKIGYTAPRSGTNMYLLMILEAAGIDRSKVELVPVGGVGANLTAVLSGAIDAGILAEPLWSINKSKVKPIFWTTDFVPVNMVETVGIVDVDYAKANPAKIRAILEGRRKAVDFIYSNPDEAADITAKPYNMAPALAREIFARYAKEKYWSRGDINYEGMNNMVRGLQILGTQKGDVDWAKVVDTSYLPKDLQVKTN